MENLLITHAHIVNEGRTYTGTVWIADGFIKAVWEDNPTTALHIAQLATQYPVYDALGAWLLPGVIDEHVHFRDPGLTQKADIHSESHAAAAGGVTSYFDMPNTSPTTTNMAAWDAKMQWAATQSLVNYTCFFGATNHNPHLLPHLDKTRVPGVKLFMGASTGDMLVDSDAALHQVFAQSPLPIMTHCEYSPLINQNMATIKEATHSIDPDIHYHPSIRSAEACYQSTQTAIELARHTGARLHIAHLTTARELALIPPHDPNIIAEACLPHLLFSEVDYDTLGTRIKCNPAIKTLADRTALRAALSSGHIYTIGTDHAPHLLADKVGGAAKAASGMPMIQFSLIMMLDLVSQGVLSLPRLVSLMAHHPATFYQIAKRGFIRPGYHADLVLVRRLDHPHTITDADVLSKCGWTPLAGRTTMHEVVTTWCNGTCVYHAGTFPATTFPSQALRFER